MKVRKGAKYSTMKRQKKTREHTPKGQGRQSPLWERRLETVPAKKLIGGATSPLLEFIGGTPKRPLYEIEKEASEKRLHDRVYDQLQKSYFNQAHRKLRHAQSQLEVSQAHTISTIQEEGNNDLKVSQYLSNQSNSTSQYLPRYRETAFGRVYRDFELEDRSDRELIMHGSTNSV